jgi:hypothetical protein
VPAKTAKPAERLIAFLVLLSCRKLQPHKPAVLSAFVKTHFNLNSPAGQVPYHHINERATIPSQNFVNLPLVRFFAPRAAG